MNDRKTNRDREREVDSVLVPLANSRIYYFHSVTKRPYESIILFYLFILRSFFSFSLLIIHHSISKRDDGVNPGSLGILKPLTYSRNRNYRIREPDVVITN